MQNFLYSLGGSPILLQLCFITLGAFLVTRITKLMKLPNVTGYILCGILIGPYVLRIIPAETVTAMDFVTDIALALISFGVGKYMKLKNFRNNVGRVIVITLFETLTAMAVITMIMHLVFRLALPFSLLIGAIGASTAPASTIMNIRTLKAKGEFVETTVQVIAIDNLISIIAFSIAAAIVQTSASSGSIDPDVVVVPILMNMIGIVVGFLMGFILKYLLKVVGTDDSRLVLTIASVVVITYICSIMDISPLLASMSLGATYINITEDKKLYKLINQFSPPVLMIFFVVSGMRLDVTMLKSAGIIGVVYFIVRIIVKYIAAFMGSAITRAARPIRLYLGLALIPQAGVSVGLCALAQRILPAELGSVLSAVILSSAVLYEIVGPVLSKSSLYLSGSVKNKKDKKSKKKKEALPTEEDSLRPVELPTPNEIASTVQEETPVS
ncbi:MAG: cation:proton antiporter [Ruminococcaceae bacterium]|nr:cation:proton antiporter [Oscillospiraceae bacterium]